MKKQSIFLALAVLLLALSGGSAKSVERADLINFKTQRVIVFKDGYSLIIKKGIATTDASGEIQTAQVPDAAVLGSFWATVDEGELIGMVAGWRKEKSTNQVSELCQNQFQILEANKGRRCEILMSDNRTLTGIIRETMSTEKLVPVGDASLRRHSDPFANPPTLTQTRVQRSGSYVVLFDGEKDHLIWVSHIKSLTMPEMELHTQHEIRVERREKRLTFRFTKPQAKREITLMYFRPGIRWIPTYRINLPHDGPKIAKVIMQAEVMNEAEDILDTPIDIVVGVPNFRFKATPSPLVLESVMRNALGQAAPMLLNQMRNNFSNSAYGMRSSAGNTSATAPIQLPSELSAARSQDLFIYSLPNVTLKKGERMAMKIVEIEAPYRDVYTWDLHLTRHDIATAPSSKGASPLKLSENKIWRQIELTNTTSIPWTTGAAMIMQGHQPLAQELLTYTSIGNRCRIPVTISVDTMGTVNEKETHRKLSALTWDRYKYALIGNEFTIELANNKSELIDIELTVSTGGRVTEAGEGGDVILLPFIQSDWVNYRGSTAVNNSSRIVWKTRIAPGDCFSPQFAMEFYTRH